MFSQQPGRRTLGSRSCEATFSSRATNIRCAHIVYAGFEGPVESLGFGPLVLANSLFCAQVRAMLDPKTRPLVRVTINRCYPYVREITHGLGIWGYKRHLFRRQTTDGYLAMPGKRLNA
jgi:hypothetical protein